MTTLNKLSQYKGKFVDIYQKPLTREEDSFEGVATIEKIISFDKSSNLIIVKVSFETEDGKEIVTRRFFEKDIFNEMKTQKQEDLELTRHDMPKEVKAVFHTAIQEEIIDYDEAYVLGSKYKDNWDELVNCLCEYAYADRHVDGSKHRNVVSYAEKWWIKRDELKLKKEGAI